MQEADRDKLIKILRMFSSSHDGEVAAAARRAHELVRLRNLDWDDLIIPVGGYPGGNTGHAWEQAAAYESEADLIRRCDEHSEYLSAWESEFIASIGESVVEWGHLTPKQRAVLDRIVNKLKLRGAW